VEKQAKAEGKSSRKSKSGVIKYSTAFSFSPQKLPKYSSTFHAV